MKGAFTQVIQGAGGSWVTGPKHLALGLDTVSNTQWFVFILRTESYNCKCCCKLKAFAVLSLLLWCLLMVSLMGCLTKMSGAQTSLDLGEAPKAKIRKRTEAPEEGS